MSVSSARKYVFVFSCIIQVILLGLVSSRLFIITGDLYIANEITI